ncbi:unnamed protein product [Calypogeia fissa]
MGRAGGELKMVAPSVHLFLPSPIPTSAIPVPLLLHSGRSRKCELIKQHQTSPGTRGLGHGLEQGRLRSSLWLRDSSSPGNSRIRATKDAESCSNSETAWNEWIESHEDVGRRVIISAAAAVLIQCAIAGEDLAIAATYSPSVAGQQQVSSFSVDSLDHCNAAPPNTKKVSRVGTTIAKLSLGTDAVSKQSTPGLRKPVSLVKRSGASLARLKSNLLARQVVCSSVGTISAAGYTSSFSALTRLGLALDFSVLRSSFGTSINLLSLCSLVVWLQRSGQLPADTPVILSQVAFKLFIPCFLLSKVATTLSSSSASNLVALPLMAFAQVIVGAMLGKLASQIFFKVPVLRPAVDWSGDQAVDNSSSLAFSEHQLSLTRAATKKQAMITAACAFGNSLTLPLVFLSGVLATTEEANRAAGYLALYMVGWSPAMWSVGFKILTAGDEEEVSESNGEQPIWKIIINRIGSIMNPPLYGVFVGLLIGGTPLAHLFLGGQEGAVLDSTAFDTVGVYAKLRSVTAGILSPLFEAASLLGTATLAVQTVVLATSLGASWPKPGDKSEKKSHHEADSQLSVTSAEFGTSLSRIEQPVLDSKAFWVIATVRLILLPFSGIFFCFILQCYHLLPADPIYRLVLLAEASMPTAQNLVLLAQLNAGTRPLAGMLASLLLRQYALSVFPLTFWMAIFLTFAPVS